MHNFVFKAPRQLKQAFSINVKDGFITYKPKDLEEECVLKSTEPLDIHTDHFFEITLTSLPPGSVVALGLATSSFPCQGQLPGWVADSVGYHSDDGNVFLGSNYEVWKAPSPGDAIGCGIEKGQLYFTLNSLRFNSNFPLDPTKGYFPTIGFSGPSSINIGATGLVKENVVFPSSIEGTNEDSVRCVGNEVSCVNNNSGEYWTAKSNIPIKVSPETSFYFEIKIQSIFATGVIAIGMCTKDFPTSQSLPGWVHQSFGYHSDDGCLFANNGEKAKWNPFGVGDVVGCGIEAGKLYFTRNKERLETKLKLPETSFYMAVGMEQGSSWTYNLGSTPFVNSSISSQHFKQPKLPPTNQNHPLLAIPHCIWPFLVSHSLEKTSQRHNTWVALLSTCKALRDYLLPLFLTLSPTDYSLALQGYYIWPTRMTDYYLQIEKDKVTFTVKTGSYGGYPNSIKKKTDNWRMKRKVLGPKKQKIEIVTTVFDMKQVDFVPDFEFDRYQPTGLEHQKETKVNFNKHLKKPKKIATYIKCGAAVITPDTPCCHEAISDIARGIFERIPKDYEGYNRLLLEMAVVVEELSQECMATAMTDVEIHQRIIQNMITISPELTPTLIKIQIQ